VPGGKEHVAIKHGIIKRAGDQPVVRIILQRRVRRDADTLTKVKSEKNRKSVVSASRFSDVNNV